MKSFLFIGDSHGDLAFVEHASNLARKHSAEIISVGDWGFLWPGHDQLRDLSDMLVGAGVRMYFCDGNHDDHARLKKLRGRIRVQGVHIDVNVIYQPRGSVYEDDDGTRFLFLGGAPSIDRDDRTEGLSWWPEETITEPEFQLARSAKGPIHVLVTHDAPDYPPGFSPKGTPGYRRDQTQSMRRIDALIRQHRPALHIHGHWHTRYSRAHKNGTRIIGLDCNQNDPACLSDSAFLWSRDES